MKNKGQKTITIFNQTAITILNWITVVCGILALVLLFNGNVGFENPLIWIMCWWVLSSVSALIAQYFKKK